MWTPDPLGFTAALVVAVGASFHCVGMCGGFALGACACSQTRARGWSPALRSQLLYHVGKTTSYLFLGALAGSFGTLISSYGTTATRVVSLLAAAVLLLAGCVHLGLLSLPRAGRGQDRLGIFRLWAKWGGGILSLRSPLMPLYLGAFSGLLPCPLVYAFLASAAASRAFPDALLTMVALGLGTVPVLLVVALTGTVFSPLLRLRLLKVGGVLMILLALWTCYRGWLPTPCCARAPLESPSSSPPVSPTSSSEDGH